MEDESRIDYEDNRMDFAIEFNSIIIGDMTTEFYFNVDFETPLDVSIGTNKDELWLKINKTEFETMCPSNTGIDISEDWIITSIPT